MEQNKENIEDWKPTFEGYGDNVGKIFNYERNWFCNDNKIIHHSEKEVLNCKHCKSKYRKNGTD